MFDFIFIARFCTKVDASAGVDACWWWTAGTNDDGYGSVFVAKGKTDKAHRIAWRLFRGVIPEGLSVLHHCDHPPCCNPRHLFLGTHLDNVQDRTAKGRTAKSLAKLTPCQVAEIRAELRKGVTCHTRAELARRYGVSWGCINEIFHGRNWPEVA